MTRTLAGVLLVAAATLTVPAGAQTRAVTDAAGRSVQVPVPVARIFAAGPPASIMLYTLAPQALLGWNRPPREAELEFIVPAYRDLPELGRLTGRGDTANVEVVLAARPDVIVDYGSTGATFRSLAERVQEQTGIPYLLLDGAFRSIPETYRLLGGIVAVPERAEALAGYTERTFARVDAVLAEVPASARPRVYYGRGPDGLETGLAGSINVEVLEVVGASNVAAESSIGGNLSRVSLEDVLRWNPEVILTLDEAFYTHATGSGLWSGIDAVRNGRVYVAPRLPFGWFDRPPSVNRLIGVLWLLAVLYPQHAQVDLAAETREFYRLFYHLELSDAQLERLLSKATGTTR